MILNGGRTLGVNGWVHFENPLWIGGAPTLPVLGANLNDRLADPALFTRLLHLGFRASADEIDHQFQLYDSPNSQVPMLPPEVLMCGGRTR